MTAPARVLRVPTVPARPAPARRTPLRLVPQRRSQARRTPFVLAVLLLLAAGLLGLLVLNTLVAQDSFALHDLAKERKALAVQEQELTRQVQDLQDPASVAARATRLGMVPGGPPAFLQLPSGRVLGKPTAGRALPKPAPKPVAKAAPQAGAVTPTAGPATGTPTGTATTPTASTTWTAPKPTPGATR